MPIPRIATCAPASETRPIVVSYTGASDALSGLKTVTLWYKKSETGNWTNSSGLMHLRPPVMWGKASVVIDATDIFTLSDGFARGMRVKLQDGAMLTATGVLGADEQGPVLRVNKSGKRRPASPC